MSTQPAAGLRSTARIWESRGRLCLAFSDRGGYPQWTEMLADWRRTFVKGRKAHWLRGGQCWSIRASERARVLEWCTAWNLDVAEGADR